jgi:kinase suppressor of Ras 2
LFGGKKLFFCSTIIYDYFFSTIIFTIIFFRTIIYEMLALEFPLRMPDESDPAKQRWMEWPQAIYQVGAGLKPDLDRLQQRVQIPKELRDIVQQCWAYDPAKRLGFTGLHDQLNKLPRKKLARVPSTPAQFSRAVDALI